MISVESLTPTFLAASLAFLAAVLVQAFVIPWVQARTRKRERWEEAIVELASIVEEQLPRAMSELRSAVQGERLCHTLRGDPQYNQESVGERLRVSSAERRQASEVVGQHLQRVRLLTARVSRMRKRAPFWRRFQVWEMGLDVFAGGVGHFGGMNRDSELSNDEWEEKWRSEWKRYEDAEKLFVDALGEIEASMRPPPRQLLKRASRLIKSLPTRIKELPAKRNEAEPTLRSAQARADRTKVRQ